MHLCNCLVASSNPTLQPSGLYPPDSSIHGISRQEWLGPFPSTEDLPNQEVKLAFAALAGRFFTGIIRNALYLILVYALMFLDGSEIFIATFLY